MHASSGSLSSIYSIDWPVWRRNKRRAINNRANKNGRLTQRQDHQDSPQ